MIFLLFKYRLKMLLSTFKEGKKVGRTILLLIAVLSLAFMFISMFVGIYEFAKINPEMGEKFIHYLTAVSFHGMFVFMCFWGLSMAVMHVFFSNDLEMLLTLPIKPRDIYIFKIAEATFLNIRLSLLFLVPSLIILGIYFGAPLPYYAVALLVAIFMTAIPGALGIVLASLLSRKIPKARLKGMLTVVGSLIGVIFWVLMNRFGGQFSSETADMNLPIEKMASLANSPVSRWLPSDWAYKAASEAAFSNWAQSMQYFALLAVVSVGLTYLALKSISLYYSSGISEEIAQPKIAVGGFRIGGSPLMAHIRRDLTIFWREPGAITQCLIMLLFLLLFPFVTSQKGVEKVAGLTFSPVNAMFAAFFGGQLGSRLIPIEKLGFWQNLAAPRGRNLALLSKVIFGLVFVTVLSIPVALIHYLTGRAADPGEIPLVVAFAWAGLAFGIPMGIYFANFNWEHPRRMLKSNGAFIYSMGTMIGALVLYGLLFVGTKFLSGAISPIFFMMFISCCLLVASISISAAKLSNMEWNPEK